ncbi:hypothetical protein KZX29_05945 [Moraxella osloensis]|uniref:hypothetical protein n=1 Tax=Faucicola osloensis TaxID=34062 RepID=UPI0020031579|nr:hypothetical protein [Moraxella osloensis]MCK6158339.1 hypothetical protein [Moraxella osloensis]
MRKQSIYILIFSSILTSNMSFAVSSNPKDEKNNTAVILNQIDDLKALNSQQADRIKKLQEQNTTLTNTLQQYQTQYQTDIAGIQNHIAQIETKQSSANNEINKVNQSVTSLSQNTQSTTQQISEQLSNRTIAIGLGLLALLGLLVASFWALRKRQTLSSQGLSNQLQTALNNVKQSEENIVKSDTALADKLLEVVEKLKENTQVLNFANSQELAQSPQSTVNNEPDHGLALKLADEIHRMRKRIEALPQDTKGLKSLNKSLERLEEELNEQGYELVDYLGSDYTENMSINAKFVGSDDVDAGRSIITKVVSPQVNYQEKMIRMADVEVSVG